MEFSEFSKMRKQQVNELLQRAQKLSGMSEWPIFNESLEGISHSLFEEVLQENDIHVFTISSNFPSLFEFLHAFTQPHTEPCCSGMWHIQLAEGAITEDDSELEGITLVDEKYWREHFNSASMNFSWADSSEPLNV